MQSLYPAVPFEFEKYEQSPLNGEFVFVEGAENVLPQRFLEDVEACLTFNDPPLVPLNAMGRSYFVELPADYGPYNALQISGGGYVDGSVQSLRALKDQGIVALYPPEQSAPIRPLRAQYEEFEAGGTSYVDDEGKVQTVYSKGILGTYTSGQGDCKVQKTHEVWQRLGGGKDSLLVPRVIGKFVYNLPDGEGGAQTAVLMLVPNNGLRADHDLQVVEMQLSGLSGGASLSETAREFRQQEIPKKMRALGFGLAKVHDLGYAHNQTHLGNLATVPMEGDSITAFIADWDTSRQPFEDFRLRAQAKDFYQMVASAIGWVHNMERTGIVPALWGPVKALANSALQGYAAYYNHNDSEGLTIPARAMVEHSSVSYGREAMLEFFSKVLAEARSDS